MGNNSLYSVAPFFGRVWDPGVAMNAGRKSLSTPMAVIHQDSKLMPHLLLYQVALEQTERQAPAGVSLGAAQGWSAHGCDIFIRLGCCTVQYYFACAEPL